MGSAWLDGLHWTFCRCDSITRDMKTPRQDPPKASDRNDRLKAALQANIARRKAQTKAKTASAKANARSTSETEGTEDA